MGSPLGFFAILVQRYEPYNSCRDIALMHLPERAAPELQVFHRRNMDMVVKAGQGQTLYWLYDNRTGKGLGKIPFFLKGFAGDAQPLGESAGNGVLLSDREIQESDLVMAKNAKAGDMALAGIDRGPQSDREVRITVFSDRDFYKPGDTVHIAGMVKEYAVGEDLFTQSDFGFPGDHGPRLAEGQKQTRCSSTAGAAFTMNTSPTRPARKGVTRFTVSVADAQSWQGQHDITIDYYQPNTFEMTISGMAKHYLLHRHFPPGGQRLLSGGQSHGRG